MNLHVITVPRVVPELLQPPTTVVNGDKTALNQIQTTKDYTDPPGTNSDQNSSNAAISKFRASTDPNPINEHSNQYSDVPANDSFSKIPTFAHSLSTLSKNFIGQSLSENGLTRNSFPNTPINAQSNDTLNFMTDPGDVLDELTAMFEDGPAAEMQ